MKANVVIDIETVIHPVTKDDVEAYMQAWEPPGTVKRDETIAKRRAEAEASAVDEIAKERAFSLGGKRMISCALGIADETTNTVGEIEVFYGDDLHKICSETARYLDSCGEYRLIGWNHINFDLPELVKSFSRTGVRPRRKPSKWDIVDLCKTHFYRLKLKETARAFGLEVPEMDGSAVQELYANGDWETIATYNAKDVELTGKLFLATNTLFSF